MNPETMAREAMAAYAIEPDSLTFLRHNENAVYKVTEGSASFVLRLHFPHANLSGNVVHRQDWIEGEMRFLRLMDAESSIAVQRPVANRAGQLVTMVHDNPATLLTWLPGESLDRLAALADDTAYRVGAMVAELHTFVQEHPETKTLARPAYDADRVMETKAMLRHGIALGLYDEAAYTQISRSADRIAELIAEAEQMPGEWGLTHSDLGLGNLIFHNEAIAPIDFSLSGFAPFSFDVGGLLAAFDAPSQRKAMLKGYTQRRPLRDRDIAVAEACFLWNIYLFMAMHLRNANVREWFGRRLPVVLDAYAKPLLAGESFIEGLLSG